jgi:HNH endonuclease/AP2 domain
VESDGYGRAYIGARTVLAHRQAFLLAHGPVPAGRVVGHACRSAGSCNPAHLKALTRKEVAEANGPTRRSKTRIRGVFPDGPGRWRAAVVDQRRQHNVGGFGSLEAADEAVRLARCRLFTANHADRAVPA